MNRILAFLATLVMLGIGYFYFMEMSEVSEVKIAAQVAVENVALATKSDRSVRDEHVRALFNTALSRPDVDVLEVTQSVQEPSPGKFRRSIAMKGRAKTTLSKYFDMDGAEISVVASQDLDSKP